MKLAALHVVLVVALIGAAAFLFASLDERDYLQSAASDIGTPPSGSDGPRSGESLSSSISVAIPQIPPLGLEASMETSSPARTDKRRSFAPDNFRGPTAPPTIIGPSANPPNY
jgi:hypothetical protein